MKKRKLKALRLNKKFISNFENSSIHGGDDANTGFCTLTRFTRDHACYTKDVFICQTGDVCPTVYGCPSFIRC